MGSVKDVKDSKGFCDEVFTELSGMKKKLVELREGSRGSDNDIVRMFERHLAELIDEIDWKFQILAHSCPYDWKGSADFEDQVQVNEADRAPDSDKFSGGYLGG